MNETVAGVVPGTEDRERVLEVAEHADRAGLDQVWIGENWGDAAVPTLTQALERTQGIDVCAGVLNVYSRTPALVAMTATTLSRIGDGRFRLALGVSSPALVEGFHGCAFDRPLRRTREFIEILRSLLAGERVTYDGECFDLGGYAVNADTPDACPIYTAALGETNRQLAGEFADGWLPLLLPASGLEDAMAAVERGLDRGDRDADALQVAPWIPTCISPEEPDTAKAHVRGIIGFYVGAMGEYYADVVSDFGYGDEAAAIQEGWDAEGHRGAAAAVTDEMVADFAAAGTPTEAAESIAAFRSAGADAPIAYLPVDAADPDLIETTIANCRP